MYNKPLVGLADQYSGIVVRVGSSELKVPDSSLILGGEFLSFTVCFVFDFVFVFFFSILLTLRIF